MSRLWNTKVTKAHETHENKPCRRADFRAFRGLSQLSWSKRTRISTLAASTPHASRQRFAKNRIQATQSWAGSPC